VARGESLAAACAGAGGCGIRCAEALARFRSRALLPNPYSRTFHSLPPLCRRRDVGSARVRW